MASDGTIGPVPREGRAVIGIAGMPGSGKSEVTRWLERQGAESIEADRIGHQLLEPESPVFSELLKEFGRDTINECGALDRRRLGQKVFNDRDALDRLNRLVHPLITQRLHEAIALYRTDPNERSALLVIDAALIPEWGVDTELDELLFITAPCEQRAERLRMSRGWSNKDRIQREEAQWSEERKRSKATKIVHNRGSLDDLERSLQALLPNLMRKP